MTPPKWSPRTLLRRLWRGRSWKQAALVFVTALNRNRPIVRVGVAILVVWLVSAVGLRLAERDNPDFDTLGDAAWNAWVILFGDVQVAPKTFLGRVLTMLLIVSGVALAGLFTATVASLLIERYLRRREVSSVEMEDHLVLCGWAARGLEWVREVHSPIVQVKRPIVIIHDHPDVIDLPDRQDDPAFADVYIIKGDPVNEVILKRARVHQAHSVVIFSDDRQGDHADGKTILVCIAARHVCRADPRPNVLAECSNPRFRPHLRKAGADEVISSSELGLRLLARASLYHGMTRVYQELLTVGRDANEMYLMPIPPGLVGKPFVEAAAMFLRHRDDKRSCLLIGVQRGDKMMLNPVGTEAGPLEEGDELVLLSQVFHDPSLPLPTDPPLAPADASSAAR